MFFESQSEIIEIARKNGTSIFVVPDVFSPHIDNALIVQPESTVSISIDQIRELKERLNIRQLSDQFVVIRPADKINLEAANALLKQLEEPNDKIHFILMTSEPTRLLPTILSRAAIYFLRRELSLKEISTSDEKIKSLAKRLITADARELTQIAEEISKTKNNSRRYALEILEIAIEMLYKSYFITSREIFYQKLPKFLTAYDNIVQNGHIKLHLVADLC